MTSIKNHYETIMVFSVGQGDEGVKALNERFRNLIAENGTIDAEEDWGKRRLAYPIEDELDGYYYLTRFTSEPDFPAELDRVYKITDGVLRTIIVRLDVEDAPAPAAVPAPSAEPAVAEPAPVLADEDATDNAADE